MYTYVINVAKRDATYPHGYHVFRVSLEHYAEREARYVFDLLKVKFPESEGYVVEVMRREDTATILTW